MRESCPELPRKVRPTLGQEWTVGVTVRHKNFKTDTRSDERSSQSVIEHLLAQLLQALENDKVVYFHCCGGRGRAGLVVACLLSLLSPELDSRAVFGFGSIYPDMIHYLVQPNATSFVEVASNENTAKV